MKRKDILVVCAATLILAVASGCATAGQTADPIAIVKAANERLAAGDLDGFMAYYAEEVVLSDAFGRLDGTAAIRDAYEAELAKPARYELSDFRADGNVVTFTNKVYHGDSLMDTFSALDVIIDGKIIFDGTAETYQKECQADPSQKFCQK